MSTVGVCPFLTPPADGHSSAVSGSYWKVLLTVSVRVTDGIEGAFANGDLWHVGEHLKHLKNCFLVPIAGGPESAASQQFPQQSGALLSTTPSCAMSAQVASLDPGMNVYVLPW